MEFKEEFFLFPGFISDETLNDLYKNEYNNSSLKPISDGEPHPDSKHLHPTLTIHKEIENLDPNDAKVKLRKEHLNHTSIDKSNKSRQVTAHAIKVRINHENKDEIDRSLLEKLMNEIMASSIANAKRKIALTKKIEEGLSLRKKILHDVHDSIYNMELYRDGPLLKFKNKFGEHKIPFFCEGHGHTVYLNESVIHGLSGDNSLMSTKAFSDPLVANKKGDKEVEVKDIRKWLSLQCSEKSCRSPLGFSTVNYNKDDKIDGLSGFLDLIEERDNLISQFEHTKLSLRNIEEEILSYKKELSELEAEIKESSAKNEYIWLVYCAKGTP